MLPNEVTVNFKFRPKLWLVSPFAAFLVIVLYLLPWGAASAPAWVQALGAVAGVFVAVFVASGQQRRQEQSERRKERVVIKAIAEIARRGSMWVEQIHMLASHGEAKAQSTRFLQAIDAVEREWQLLQAVRLTDLPDESLVNDFSLLEHNLRSCVDSARRYLAGAQGEELRSIGIKVTFNKNIVRDIAERLATETP
ncbi:hypothetical protein [Pseudomonas sp. CC6-YY-74]|uniref:hypothetical protein n=1 Tax=Pseudomonas sp. CC6-YY-74 TaxID=1930532 RepID=UPI0009A19D7B|nr:hypothetical protein [Pseudomonas sp. CC6-YY-74]